MFVVARGGKLCWKGGFLCITKRLNDWLCEVASSETASCCSNSCPCNSKIFPTVAEPPLHWTVLTFFFFLIPIRLKCYTWVMLPFMWAVIRSLQTASLCWHEKRKKHTHKKKHTHTSAAGAEFIRWAHTALSCSLIAQVKNNCGNLVKMHIVEPLVLIYLQKYII